MCISKIINVLPQNNRLTIREVDQIKISKKFDIFETSWVYENVREAEKYYLHVNEIEKIANITNYKIKVQICCIYIVTISNNYHILVPFLK